MQSCVQNITTVRY